MNLSQTNTFLLVSILLLHIVHPLETTHMQIYTRSEPYCSLMSTNTSFVYDCNYYNTPSSHYDHTLIPDSNDSP